MAILTPSSGCVCGNIEPRCEENKITTLPTTPTDKAKSTNPDYKSVIQEYSDGLENPQQINQKSEECQSDDNHLFGKLPHDLLYSLLAPLSCKEHARLRAISADLKRVVDSEEFRDYRKQNGRLEPRILVVAQKAGTLEGNSPKGRFKAYLPTHDKWLDVTPIPASTVDGASMDFEGSACVGLGSCFYVLGGRRWPANNSSGQATTCGDVWKYDATLDRWTSCEEMKPPRSWFAAAAIGKKIYVAGGQTTKDFLELAQVYDTEENKWEDLPHNLTHQRLGCQGVSFENQFWVIGGQFVKHVTADNDDFQSVYAEVYNPVTKSWRLVSQTLGHPDQAGWNPEGSREMEGPVVVAAGKLLCLQDKKIWWYDQGTTQWHQVGDGPAGVGSGFVSVGTQIFRIGGESSYYRPAVTTLDKLDVCDVQELEGVMGDDRTYTPLVWKPALAMGYEHGAILGTGVVLV
ncbi:hypothetical protein R1sor_002965 [Riccia sorocarpa]|uniref:F-box domain-containing protein n=1 Tax=Riccia sorocarpa TaxID=122646 RepID=A0ABD3H0M1_9MARC